MEITTNYWVPLRLLVTVEDLRNIWRYLQIFTLKDVTTKDVTQEIITAKFVILFTISVEMIMLHITSQAYYRP